LGTVKKRKKIGQYKPKQKNEIRLSGYLKKNNNELR